MHQLPLPAEMASPAEPGDHLMLPANSATPTRRGTSSLIKLGTHANGHAPTSERRHLDAELAAMAPP